MDYKENPAVCNEISEIHRKNSPALGCEIDISSLLRNIMEIQYSALILDETRKFIRNVPVKASDNPFEIIGEQFLGDVKTKKFIDSWFSFLEVLIQVLPDEIPCEMCRALDELLMGNEELFPYILTIVNLVSSLKYEEFIYENIPESLLVRLIALLTKNIQKHLLVLYMELFSHFIANVRITKAFYLKIVDIEKCFGAEFYKFMKLMINSEIYCVPEVVIDKVFSNVGFSEIPAYSNFLLMLIASFERDHHILESINKFSFVRHCVIMGIANDSFPHEIFLQFCRTVFPYYDNVLDVLDNLFINYIVHLFIFDNICIKNELIHFVDALCCTEGIDSGVILNESTIHYIRDYCFICEYDVTIATTFKLIRSFLESKANEKINFVHIRQSVINEEFVDFIKDIKINSEVHNEAELLLPIAQLFITTVSFNDDEKTKENFDNIQKLANRNESSIDDAINDLSYDSTEEEEDYSFE